MAIFLANGTWFDDFNNNFMKFRIVFKCGLREQ